MHSTLLVSVLIFAPLAASIQQHRQRHKSKNISEPALRCPSSYDERLHWAFFVDGKDAHKGPGAYDWDRFENDDETGQSVPSALRMIWESKDMGQLSDVVLGKIQRRCCGLQKPRRYSIISANGAAYECLDALDCHSQRAILAEVPRELWSSNINLARCEMGQREGNDTRLLVNISGKLSSYVAVYNREVDVATTSESKLHALAKFLRSFAYLHPNKNFNGRFRTLVLQREVRRLGLACGTLMYNNNRDIFTTPLVRYVQKIQEGIRMYEMLVESGKNPWLDSANVRSHQEKLGIQKELSMVASHCVDNLNPTMGTRDLQQISASHGEQR